MGLGWEDGGKSGVGQHGGGWGNGGMAVLVVRGPYGVNNVQGLGLG